MGGSLWCCAKAQSRWGRVWFVGSSLDLSGRLYLQLPLSASPEVEEKLRADFNV